MKAIVIRGLHLWSIELNGTAECLWITTTNREMVDALVKAKRFLKKKNTRFDLRMKKPIGATYHGTLDA